MPQSGIHSNAHADEHCLFRIRDVQYVAVPIPILPRSNYPANKIVPVTVIAETLHEHLNETRVKNLIDRWLRADDAFCPEFLQNVVFIMPVGQTSDLGGIQSSLQSLWGTEWSSTISLATTIREVYQELHQFREDYRAKYSKEPYGGGKNVNEEQHKDALERLAVYKEFLLKEVLQGNLREALVVLSITSQAVDYRNATVDPPSAPNALDGIWLAPILSAPELSVPIEEMEYVSDLSKRKEHLLIVVSLLGRPGSDMKLLDTACRTLDRSGRTSLVSTGSKMNIGGKFVKEDPA
ncbi:hypothetical protein M501DRAFT_1019857 [Patellaria atrata CBS 101060]|uniref:Scytalone dehydratase-like protein Arp1 N-terminal domain-containing protein n=1 Tax=Patellaria atrata CBS 101060 TaxID=1346257 RepID=A0A9P4S359_9PEZI|nr:hypothetical protein M501DRAFT_1019857 [Patellaria atrata CBS 101060]